LFSPDLNGVSFTDFEEFLAIKGPEEPRPSDREKIDYTGSSLAENAAARPKIPAQDNVFPTTFEVLTQPPKTC
jgi:hypothetical protein